MDLGDKYTELCVVEADHEVSERTRIATTAKAIENYFSRCPKSRVAMETGTHSRWASKIAAKFAHEVLVANTRKLRAIYQNDRKNDVADAEMLAKIAQVQPTLLCPIHHRGEEAQAARALLLSRNTVVETRSKLINHVRGVVKTTGERMPRCSAESFCKRIEELPAVRRAALEPVMKLIEQISVEICSYDRMIDELIRTKFPDAMILQQVSGIGPVTSLAFVATIEDPNRFPRNRSVGAMVGMCPRQDKSCSIDKQLPISKAGDVFLRCLLVGSAEYILGPFGPDTDLRRWGLVLASHGGKNAKKRAVVAVARKLAVLLLALWKTGGTYEPLRQANRVSASGSAPTPETNASNSPAGGLDKTSDVVNPVVSQVPASGPGCDKRRSDSSKRRKDGRNNHNVNIPVGRIASA